MQSLIERDFPFVHLAFYVCSLHSLAFLLLCDTEGESKCLAYTALASNSYSILKISISDVSRFPPLPQSQNCGIDISNIVNDCDPIETSEKTRPFRQHPNRVWLD